MISDVKHFEVILRKRIPYLTSLLSKLAFIFGIGVLIVYLFLLPAKDQSGEMQTAYFILVVPDFIKSLLVICLPSSIIIFILFVKMRLYKNATLSFFTNHISIVGKNFQIELPVQKLEKVICADPLKYDGTPKGKLIIYVIPKRLNSKVIRLYLKDYQESEAFMEEFLKYDSIQFIPYNSDYVPIVDEEE